MKTATDLYCRPGVRLNVRRGIIIGLLCAVGSWFLNDAYDTAKKRRAAVERQQQAFGRQEEISSTVKKLAEGFHQEQANAMRREIIAQALLRAHEVPWLIVRGYDDSGIMTVLEASASAEAMFSAGPQGLNGRNVDDLIPKRYEAVHQDRALRKDMDMLWAVHTVRCMAHTVAGTEFRAVVRLAGFELHGQRYYVCRLDEPRDDGTWIDAVPKTDKNSSRGSRNDD